MHKLVALVGAGALIWAGLSSPAFAAEKPPFRSARRTRPDGRCLCQRRAGGQQLQAGQAGRAAQPGGRLVRGGDHRGRCQGRLRSGDRPGRPGARGRRATTPQSPIWRRAATRPPPCSRTTSPRPTREGRLTVRHTAAAPAVDILAGGDPVIEGLENPDEEVLELDAGTVEAAVAAAGDTDPLIGPADVTVREGMNTIVYAWGSPAGRQPQGRRADHLRPATPTPTVWMPVRPGWPQTRVGAAGWWRCCCSAA